MERFTTICVSGQRCSVDSTDRAIRSLAMAPVGIVICFTWFFFDSVSQTSGRSRRRNGSPPLMTTKSRSPIVANVFCSSSSESSCSLCFRNCSQLKQVRQNELQSYVRPTIRYTGFMPRLSTRYLRYWNLSVNFIGAVRPVTLVHRYEFCHEGGGSQVAGHGGLCAKCPRDLRPATYFTN